MQMVTVIGKYIFLVKDIGSQVIQNEHITL